MKDILPELEVRWPNLYVDEPPDDFWQVFSEILLQLLLAKYVFVLLCWRLLADDIKAPEDFVFDQLPTK